MSWGQKSPCLWRSGGWTEATVKICCAKSLAFCRFLLTARTCSVWIGWSCLELTRNIWRRTKLRAWASCLPLCFVQDLLAEAPNRDNKDWNREEGPFHDMEVVEEFHRTCCSDVPRGTCYLQWMRVRRMLLKEVPPLKKGQKNVGWKEDTYKKTSKNIHSLQKQLLDAMQPFSGSNSTMSCCRRRSSASPLECYAESMKHHAITEALEEASGACEMKFPMYTVAWEDVKQMEQVLPHEDLKEQGMLVDFDKKMGRAAFVSHQWLSAEHPDPDFQQMAVLKEALTRFTSKTFLIKPLVLGQSFQFGAQNISTEVFQSKSLFLWYDYFSLPQLKTSTDTWNLGDLDKPIDEAIQSIPAYVAGCELFLALCPMVQDLNQQKTFGQVTWANRGWCRMEKTLRQFSDQQPLVRNVSIFWMRRSFELEMIGDYWQGELHFFCTWYSSTTVMMLMMFRYHNVPDFPHVPPTCSKLYDSSFSRDVQNVDVTLVGWVVASVTS